MLLSDSIHLDSNNAITIGDRVTLGSVDAFRFTLLTTSNVVYASASSMPGVALICATNGTTAGVGTLRQATGPARLFYTAPGDTEGAAVNVSGLTSGAGRVTLASANGRQLHVAVTVAALLGVSTSSVRIASNTGSSSVTWSRASNVTTVAETAHGRAPGDAVILFGTSFQGQVFVDSTPTANTWTYTDSRANASGSGEVFGKKNIRISGLGTLDYGMARGFNVRHIADAHTIIMLGASDWSVEGVKLIDGWKYGVYGQCVSRYRCDILGYNDNASSSTAIVQINGKSQSGRISVSGTSTDNAAALIVGDYAEQTFLFPNDEGGLHFDQTTIENLDLDFCKNDVVRLAGATGQWIRNTTIRNVRTRVTLSTGFIIAAIVDAIVYLGTETNIEGLDIDGLVAAKEGINDCILVYLQTAGSNVNTGIRIRGMELGFPADNPSSGPVRLVGGNWRDIVVESAFMRSPTWQGSLVHTSGSATGAVQSLTIRDTSITIDNALRSTSVPSTFFESVNANFTINRLVIERCALRDVSATGQLASYVRHTTGLLKCIVLRSCFAEGSIDLIFNSVTDATMRIVVDEVETNNVTYMIRLDGCPREVVLRALRCFTSPVDVVRIGYSSAVVRVRSSGGMPDTPTSGFHVNIPTGTANSPNVNGVDLVCDTTKLAAVTGNLVKSSATNKVAMYDGAAWTAIA
jgi:hypothetical protein